MFKAARTPNEIDHQQGLMSAAHGCVAIAMKDGRELHGVVLRCSVARQDGYRAGYTLLDEDGTEMILDSMDTFLIVPADPSPKLVHLLRARGLLDDEDEPARPN